MRVLASVHLAVPTQEIDMSKPQYIPKKPQHVNVHAYVTKRITSQSRAQVESSAIKLALARATGLV